MTPERDELQGSLFKSTSAFVQPLDEPYPVEIIPTGVPGPSPSEILVKIAELIDDAYTELLGNPPKTAHSHEGAIDLLIEARELARKHA